MGVDDDVDKCLSEEGKTFSKPIDRCGAIVEQCVLEPGVCKYQREITGTNVCTYYLRTYKGGDEYGRNKS